MKKLITLLSFLIMASPFHAQDYSILGRYPVKNYGAEDYNGHPQNWGITCSSRGTIYSANGEGILIFDGTEWKKIILPGKAMAKAIGIDKNDRLYASLHEDFGYIGVNALGEYQYVSLIHKIPEESRNFGGVPRILAADDGVYYISLQTIFYYTGDELKEIKLNNNLFNCAVINGLAFITSSEQGIGVLKNGVFYPLPDLEEFITDNMDRVVLIPYDQDTILLASNTGRLFLYELGFFYDPALGDYDFTKTDPPKDILKFFTANTISSLLYKSEAGLLSGAKVNDNLFAFGTKGGGIILMDKKGDLVTIIDQSRGLNDNFIFGLTTDPFGNLWGASNKGVVNVTLNTAATVWDKMMGFADVPLVAHKHNNRIYVGSFGSLYYLENTEDGKPGRLNKIKNANKTSWTFHEYNDTLLVGTARGVQYIKDDTAYDFPITTFPLYVYSLASLPQFPDTVFIGTGGVMLSMNLRQTDDGTRLEHYAAGDFGNIRNQLIRWIVPDKDNNLWVSTQNSGVYHFKFTGDSLVDYEKTYYTTEHGLPSLAWNYLYRVDDTIIAATQTGLMTPVLDENGSYYFKPYTNYSEKLTDAYPMLEVLKDKDERVWVLSHDKTGMTRAEKDENGTYYLKDRQFKGLPKDFHDIYMENDDIFWLISFKGVYRYDNSHEKNFDQPFYAAINSVTTVEEEKLFNGIYYDEASGKDGNFSNYSIIQPEGLIKKLPYSKNNITFTYSAAWYENPEETRFQYILEGFDPHWSTLTDENKAVYTNLPEGSYRFRVKAINVYGTESREGIFEFSIIPPWYRTPLAFLLYGLVFTALVFGVAFFTNRYLIRAKQRLESIVQERTEEIRRQNRELEKLSIVVRETDNSVIIMDTNGDIEWANEGFTRVFGSFYADIIAKKGRNIRDISSHASINDNLEQCITKKQTIYFEHKEIRKTGNIIWLQTTLTPLVDEKGNIIKLIAIGSDITGLKQAEREAVLNAHKAGMADVAVTTIHNVGNILNTVKTTTSSIAEIVKRSSINKFLKANTLLKDNFDNLEKFIANDPKGTKLMEYYLTIEDDFLYEHTSVQDRIEKITEGIDSISEVLMTHERYVEDISSDVMEEHLDIKHLLEDTLRIHMKTLEEKEIKVIREFSGAPIIKAQKPKLLSVFLALIENAEYALSEQFGQKRKLIVRTSGVLGVVRIEIEDTGCGIQRENITDIFHHGFTTKEGHNGFGLHNAANSISDLGGKIWAESEGPGMGAKFVIQFDNKKL